MLLLAAVDLNWLLRFILTIIVVSFGLLHLLRNTASKYFLADGHNNGNDNDGSSGWSPRMAIASNYNKHNTTTTTTMITRELTSESDACAVCGNPTKKKCSRCKMVMYCSEVCQRSHWRLEHKTKCKDFQLSGMSTFRGKKAYIVTSSGSSNIIQSKKILFPYKEFVDFFNWDKSGFPPCGLLNCGNSCFANVVLQCLTYTKPLAAYLLEKGHRKKCRKNDWCFFCEFETHILRTSQSSQPFSPINILSRLPNIGGNLGYGQQEDAHEFMRFAIDTMQSVCLDEFGGEKAIHPCSQETTLIQHIFGGHLQSQVICTNCKNVSNQLENMMDLTVEIHGDAASLEQCLDQFTAKEWLHGDNMYKCDGCNDYVTAWKCLTVRQGPNVLTIALKRFQSGRFGKLNKRVSFPETLDLSPYMSEAGEENVYKLYAVIVHVDMLNASFFGHYICYIKDFRGNWYRIDDCKVNRVDLDEVLSQGAYMLLYSRTSARPSSIYYPLESLRENDEDSLRVGKEDRTSSTPPEQCQSIEVSNDTPVSSRLVSNDNCVGSSSLKANDIPETKINSSSEEISLANNSEDVKEGFQEEISKENFPKDVKTYIGGSSIQADNAETINHSHGIELSSTMTSMDASKTDILKIEHPSYVPSEVGNETGGDAGITREYSVENANQNHVNGKEQMLVDDVAAVWSSNVDFVELKSANCGEKIRKDENGDILSSVIQDAAGRLDGCRPCANLKPLFTPGFLDRCFQKRFFKEEDNASVELGGQVSSGNLNCCRNGIPTHGISSVNAGLLTGDQDNVHCGYHENILKKQLNTSDGKAQIVSNVGTESADVPYSN